MNKSTLTIIFIILSIVCKSQSIQTKYYNNEWLEKEVKIEKAKFTQTITENSDGTITKEVVNLKDNQKMRSETFKGEEPYGIWFYNTKYDHSKLDYNFPLLYSNEQCLDSLPKIKDYFEDDSTIKYKAPIFSKDKTTFQYLAQSIKYPNRPKDDGIQGTVYLIFLLTKDGNIENVRVKKGANIQLDKEAARVIREMKFSNPATLNGVAKDFCLTMPIRFVLK